MPPRNTGNMRGNPIFSIAHGIPAFQIGNSTRNSLQRFDLFSYPGLSQDDSAILHNYLGNFPQLKPLGQQLNT